MKAAAQTLEILRSTLQTGLLNSAAESAAIHYAQLCTDAESRLEMIATMLEKGSDYQALQAAEQEPPLLDLVALVSFGGEKAWMDFCQAHQLPIAPRLDAKTVQALDRLYAQGVTANHPLYKDFRAAVLSREDDRALRIVRTILKLNPADENARSEQLRLEHKQFQSRLEQLRVALKAQDEEHIAQLAEEFLGIAPQEKLQHLPEYQQADAIRRTLRRRQAAEKLPAQLTEAARQREAGDWRATAQIVEQIQESLDTHGQDLLAGDPQKQLAQLVSFISQERALAERQRSCERLLVSFSAFAEEADTRLQTGTGLSFAQIAALDEGFIRRWRELESYQMPIADATLQRLRQTGQSIRTRLDEMQRGQRTRSFLGTAALLTFMVAIATVASHGWRARAFADELVSYRARQLCEPAEKLIHSLRTEEPLMLRWPFLKTRLEEVAAWTEQSRDLDRRTDATLTELEQEAAAQFASSTPAELLQRLENARAEVGQLPADLATPANQRLAALKTKSDLKLSGVTQQRRDQSRGLLDEVSALLEKDLRYDRPAAEVAVTIQKLEGLLARLELWLKPEASTLQLPADLEMRVKAARQRVDGFKTELQRFAQIRETTASALTLTAYKKALQAWQDIRFAEAAPAQPMLVSMPSEEQFLAQILTGGDLAMWKAVQADESGPNLMPATPLDSELKILLALRDDRDLNGVWENTVIDHSRGRTSRAVWSQGPLEESRAGDSQRRWSGLCFDPHEEDTGAAFVKSDFKQVTLGSSEQGQSVRTTRLSATSAFMESLQLNRMTDANGEHWQLSVLEILDRIMSNQSAPPLAKAFVMQELDRLMRAQPSAWGRHLSPTLSADLAALQSSLAGHPLRSEDWMVPKLSSALGPALSRFFETRTSRQYFKEAQARRELLRDLSVAGLRFGGYVETDLRLQLNNAARSRTELWLLGAQGPLATLSAAPQAPQGAKPLSPVFFIPADRAALMQRYRSALHAEAPSTPTAEIPETPYFELK